MEQMLSKKIIEKSFRQYEKFPINSTIIAQDKLNLPNRNRTSLFPWRGQFSPELIELLLKKFGKKNGVVLDPFVGSGTTLFESARQSFNCYGAEINPAAVTMAETIQFVNLTINERTKLFEKVEKNLEKYKIQKSSKPSDLSSETTENNKKLLKSSSNKLIQNIITNIAMHFIESKDKSLQQCFLQHKKKIEDLPYSEKTFKVFHSDARSLPLEDNSIDMIITSPPYINVFNYHQNYRTAMELMGWDILNIAKSEFGSNRKHRGNRFFTVTQYALDMLQALKEMRRLIKKNGRIIVVIGRESSVRRIKFDNGKIISTLATQGANLKLDLRQERKFKNKFGELIYEDILHFTPIKTSKDSNDDFVRSMSKLLLNGSLKNSDGEVYANIKEAILETANIQSSQFLQVTNN